MPITNAYRALAATALVGLLAGCSGGSQLAPSGNLGAQSASHQVGVASKFSGTGRNAAIAKLNSDSRTAGSYGKPFLSAKSNLLAELNHKSIIASRQKFYPFKKTKPNSTLLFVNDEGTEDVYVYSTSTGEVVGTLSGVGFAGLATNSSGQLAIGTLDPSTGEGLINTYTVTSDGATSNGVTLSISSGFPDGITYDKKGDIYASDFPSSNVDFFSASTVSSGGGPTKTYTLPDFEYVYYVQAFGNTIYVDGDTEDGFGVGELTKKGDKVLINGIVDPVEDAGFPGGLAIDSKHNIIVNNQYGSISTYAKPYTGGPSAITEWGFDPNDVTGIALDLLQENVYGVDINFGGSSLVGYPIPFSYPSLSEGSPWQSAGEEPISAATYLPGK
jgi:hypothetical protein